MNAQLMRISVIAWTLAATTIGSGIPAALASEQACQDLIAQWDEALSTPDVDRLQSIYSAAADCQSEDGDELQAILGLPLAALKLSQLKQQPFDDAGLPAQIESVRLLTSMAHYWPAAEYLGDLLQRSRSFAEATAYYQNAMDWMLDRESTVQAVDSADYYRVRRKGEQTRLAAGGHIPATRRGNGSVGGLGCVPTRSSVVTIDRCNVPLQFPTNEVRLEEAGRRNMGDLIEQLRTAPPQHIRIIGHTDTHGADDYNLRLSVRRAEAIRRHLLDAGIRSQITVEGRGEAEPYLVEPEQRAYYETDEIDAMNRRVELRFE